MAFKFRKDALKSLILIDIKDFCRRSGCSRQQAHNYLNDGYVPSIDTLEEIAKGFGLDVDYFFKKVRK